MTEDCLCPRTCELDRRIQQWGDVDRVVMNRLRPSSCRKAGAVPEHYRRSLLLPVPGFTVRALHTLEHAGQQLLLAWMTRTAPAAPAGAEHLPPAEARDLLALWTVSEGQDSQAGVQLGFVAWQQAPGGSAQMHSLATTTLLDVAGVVGEPESPCCHEVNEPDFFLFAEICEFHLCSPAER